MSNYTVSLKIEDTVTGIKKEIDITIDVEQAPSGLYVASTPNSNLIASGKAPLYAILEYIGDVCWDKTVEAEKVEG